MVTRSPRKGNRITEKLMLTYSSCLFLSSDVSALPFAVMKTRSNPSVALPSPLFPLPDLSICFASLRVPFTS